MKELFGIPKIEISDEERARILSETERHTAGDILESTAEDETESDE